ncbi:MAG TPA: AbrB family transcriptional regulator [Paracoccaceae bacterium]|nr:AbrB family transcriptional regulator [Paracoccaceae bacterium]
MAKGGATAATWLRFGATLALAAGGGLLFLWLSIPLPFMLGSMFCVMAAALAGLPMQAPQAIRPPMSVVIGAMLGTSFSPSILATLPLWIVPLAGLSVFVGVAAVLCVVLFRRMGNMDLHTAYFAGMPGGLVDMVALADHYGADVRKVALIHSLRILLIVFSVPLLVEFLSGSEIGAVAPDQVWLRDVGAEFWLWFPPTCALGALAGWLLRLPAKYILGPMIVSAAVHLVGWTDYKLPVEMVIVAQVVIGATIGTRFVGAPLSLVRSVLPVTLVSAALLLVLTYAFALVLSGITGISAITILLSYSPGGFAEMGLVAVALGIETAFVATHHVVRIALVGFGGAVVFRLVDRGAR